MVSVFSLLSSHPISSHLISSHPSSLSYPTSPHLSSSPFLLSSFSSLISTHLFSSPFTISLHLYPSENFTFISSYAEDGTGQVGVYERSTKSTDTGERFFSPSSSSSSSSSAFPPPLLLLLLHLLPPLLLSPHPPLPSLPPPPLPPSSLRSVLHSRFTAVTFLQLIPHITLSHLLHRFFLQTLLVLSSAPCFLQP